MSKPDYAATVGQSWTGQGISTTKHTYTVLAWVDGMDGGVLFVRTGPGILNPRTGGGHNEQCWMTAAQWESWVETYKARPETDLSRVGLPVG